MLSSSKITNIFIHLILFNLHNKDHKVVAILPILLKKSLGLIGVKQLAQSHTVNRANIAYISVVQDSVLLLQLLLGQKRKVSLWVGMFSGQVYEEEVSELALD